MGPQINNAHLHMLKASTWAIPCTIAGTSGFNGCPLAILVPTNISGTGEEVHVLVEDPSGRWQTRRRFMIQLGMTPVTYMEGKPNKSIVSDSSKLF